MAKITIEYTNKKNGGTERITRDGDGYSINSRHPNPAIGWMGERKITKAEALAAMKYTGASDDLVAAILF